MYWRREYSKPQKFGNHGNVIVSFFSTTKKTLLRSMAMDGVRLNANFSYDLLLLSHDLFGVGYQL